MILTIYSKHHDQTGKMIWVVAPKKRMPTNKFSELRKELGKIGGRYSRFVSGMVFKSNPIDLLKDYEMEQVSGPPSKPIKDAPATTIDPQVDQGYAQLKATYADPNKQYRVQGSDGTDFLMQSIGVNEAGEFRYSVAKPLDHAGDVLKFSSAAVQIDVFVVGDVNWEEILITLIPPSQLAIKSHDLQVNQERLIKQLQQMPPIYGTQDTPPGETVAYLHYYGGSVDIYVTEFGPPNDLYVYGSFVDGGGFEGSYWYVDSGFIKDLPPMVELEYYWKPKQLKDIDDIRNPYYKRPEDPSSKQTREMEVIIADNYSNQYEVNKAIEGLLDKLGPEFNAWTPDAINFLQRYSGYGGLGEFMDPEKDIDIIKGTLFEYYTPDPIIKKMWGLAYKYGFAESGTVLEPSCGVGRFIKYAPVTAMVKAYEINKYSARITDASYRAAQVLTNYFESEFYYGHGGRQLNRDYEGSFDLVIGNAPFGEYHGKYAGMGEKKYSGATQVDHHFLVRGLDALKPGGLLIMIVSSRFMSGGHDKVKAVIESKGDLIDAYRLPTGIFQNTQVNADILVFRRQADMPVGTIHVVRPSHGEEPVKEEFTPRDEWRDNLFKAREYAAAIIPKDELDILTWHEKLDWSDTESIVKAIDTHLASIQKGVTQPKPEIKPTKTIIQKESPSKLFNQNFLDRFNEFVQKHTPALDVAMKEVAKQMGITLHNPVNAYFEFVRFFAENLPPKKLFPGTVGLFEIDLLEGNIMVPEIPKKVKWNLKTDPNFVKRLNKFIAKKSHRPATEGVFHDAESDMLVATDSHRLVAIKAIEDIKTTKIVPPSGFEITDKFPDYNFVFQGECGVGSIIDTQNFIDHLNGLDRMSKFFFEPIYAKIQDKETQIFINPTLLLPVIEMFLSFDEKRISGRICNIGGSGNLLYLFNGDEKIRAVCMSVNITDPDRAYKLILDFEKEAHEGLTGVSDEEIKELAGDKPIITPYDAAIEKDQKEGATGRLVRIFAIKLTEANFKDYLADYKERTGKDMPVEQQKSPRETSYQQAVKMFEGIAQKIDDADTLWLKKRLHRGNKTSKKFFTAYTGITLPTTDKATSVVLDMGDYGFNMEHYIKTYLKK